MAVEDFIPLTQPKQTVEKLVARKPSLQERTTIESPGRPSPADLLERNNSPEKKDRKKRNIRGKAEAIRIKGGNAVLIITEKPQAALKIASAIGKPKKYTEEGVSYYELEHEGKLIYVASAVGHLFGLDYVKGQKGWPIFDIEWVPSFEKKSAAFTKRYYNLLKKLANKSSEFIIASDFDVEGEVIGWNVLRFICKQKDAKRMKFSTLTENELKESFLNPLNTLAWGNAYAGETRHILDWMYGINLSRALMGAIKKTGSFRILSIGRVQGPALKIIVEKEKEINSFVSQPYWQVYAKTNDLTFKHPRDIFNKKELEIFKEITHALAATKQTKEKVIPPVPFDLTTLQKESYRLYKINPSQTLSTAQKLYLEGLISYPRTSSQKIPHVIKPKEIIQKLKKNFPIALHSTRENPIEGKKSDPTHPSIYPTGEWKELQGQEEKIYSLIVKRFLAAFGLDAEIAHKKITLTALDKNQNPLKMKYIPSQEIKDEEKIEEDSNKNIDNDSQKEKEVVVTFTANAQQIIQEGWLKIYPIKIEESTLPDVEGKIKIDEISFQEKETQAPNRYTPASLVSLLEKKNLGTKATRSMIVETLFDRGYVEGTSIKATPLGISLISALDNYSSIIIDENLTRQLEEEMEQLQSSSVDNFLLEKKEKEVIEKAKKIIIDISKEFKKNEEEIGKELSKGLTTLRQNQQEANILMQCPSCQKGKLRIMYSKKTRRYFVACSAYPECRQVYSLPPNALIKKTENICPKDNFPKLLAIRKGKRPWEFCFNPNCPQEKEKRDEWNAKKQARYQQENENA